MLNSLRKGALLIHMSCGIVTTVCHATFHEAIYEPPGTFKIVAQKIRDAQDDIVDAQQTGGSWKRKLMCRGVLGGETRLGMMERAGDKVYVSFRGGCPFTKTILSYLWPGKTDLNGCPGKVHRGVFWLYKDMASTLKSTLATQLEGSKEHPVEFVFSGYGLGGALALYAAADFSYAQKDALQPHQVKVITFSAPKVVDGVFREDLHKVIGQMNIVQFINRIDITTLRPLSYRHPGVQAYILPNEQFRDVYHDTGRLSRALARLYVLYYAKSVWTTLKTAPQWITELRPVDFLKGLCVLWIAKPFLKGAASLPSDATIATAVQYTRTNVENAIADGHADGAIPEHVGKVGFFNVNRSVMRFLPFS